MRVQVLVQSFCQYTGSTGGMFGSRPHTGRRQRAGRIMSASVSFVESVQLLQRGFGSRLCRGVGCRRRSSGRSTPDLRLPFERMLASETRVRPRIAVVVQRQYVAAAAPAIDPRRPTRQSRTSEPQRQQQSFEGFGTGTVSRPVGRTSAGVIISVIVVSAALGTAGYFGVQRFLKQREQLIVEFGEEMVQALQFVERRSVDDIPDEDRLRKELTHVTRVYSAKAPLWGQKRRMYSSFLYTLIRNVKLTVGRIMAARIAQQMLGVSERTAEQVMNALTEERLASAPSLLSKLLFLSERLGMNSKSLRIRDKLSFSAEAVRSLQQNLCESCYRDVIEERISRLKEARGEQTLTAAGLPGPGQDAELERFRRRLTRLSLDIELARDMLQSNNIPKGYELLGLGERDARTIIENFIADKERAVDATARDIEARERSIMARQRESAAEASGSGGAKPATHRFECQRCGYTLFPAAGREWKFYGDDFKCPQCGAPKSDFRDTSEQS